MLFSTENTLFGANRKFSEEIASKLKRETIDQVNTYLITGKHRRKDLPFMYFKIFLVLLWVFSSYYCMVFTSGSVYYKLVISLFVSLAIPCMLFNVTHDATHFSISKHNWVNKLFCFSADLLGISSKVWLVLHHRHHRNPNVLGLDSDLEQGALLRLTPQQKWFWFHKYQVFYVWLLFPFNLIRRNLIKDFSCLKKLLQEDKKAITKRDLINIFAGKAIFSGLVFILPLCYYSIPEVLFFYFTIFGVSGFIISVILIVAHVNDKTVFPIVLEKNGYNSDFIFQIETSVDFSKNNRILSWYVGGLNFQTEHHLFPHVCHLHYPAFSKIVEKNCQKFNVDYQANATLYEAVKSFSRWLNILGKPNFNPNYLR